MNLLNMRFGKHTHIFLLDIYPRRELLNLQDMNIITFSSYGGTFLQSDYVKHRNSHQ